MYIAQDHLTNTRYLPPARSHCVGFHVIFFFSVPIMEKYGPRRTLIHTYTHTYTSSLIRCLLVNLADVMDILLYARARSACIYTTIALRYRYLG